MSRIIPRGHLPKIAIAQYAWGARAWRGSDGTSVIVYDEDTDWFWNGSKMTREQYREFPGDLDETAQRFNTALDKARKKFRELASGGRDPGEVCLYSSLTEGVEVWANTAAGYVYLAILPLRRNGDDSLCSKCGSSSVYQYEMGLVQMNSPWEDHKHEERQPVLGKVEGGRFWCDDCHESGDDILLPVGAVIPREKNGGE